MNIVNLIIGSPAYREGKRAAKFGMPENFNPYGYGNTIVSQSQYNDWKKGWLKVQKAK